MITNKMYIDKIRILLYTCIHEIKYHLQATDNNSISPLLQLSNGEFLTEDFIELIVTGTKDFLSKKLNLKRTNNLSSGTDVTVSAKGSNNARN